MPENQAQALISDLEQKLHDLAQPLLGVRFISELLSSQIDKMHKEELASKIALINQAIHESDAIFRALSADLQKLKNFL